MVGEQYWTTGVKLCYHGDGKWGVTLDFLDSGFCNEESTEGTLRSRYISGDIDMLIETILKDAKMLNIDTTTNEQCLYVHRDGDYTSENEKEYAPMPHNWRENLKKHADKFELRWIYLQETVTEDC